MQHVSDDPRSQRSATLVWKGMKECLQETPFSKISITALCERAGIGRATFYRLFDTPVDVLSYECTLVFEQIETWLITSDAKTTRDYFLYLIETWMSERELVSALAESGQIGLLSNEQTHHFNVMRALFLHGGKANPTKERYLNATLAHLIPVTLETWVTGGCTESPEELYAIVSHTLADISRAMRP